MLRKSGSLSRVEISFYVVSVFIKGEQIYIFIVVSILLLNVMRYFDCEPSLSVSQTSAVLSNQGVLSVDLDSKTAESFIVYFSFCFIGQFVGFFRKRANPDN